MTDLSLAAARQILDTAQLHGRKAGLKPLAIAVLDARGALKAFLAEDGTSLKRAEVAQGKAFGALALGLGSRSIHKRAREQDYFIAAVSHVVGGALVPVPGGVLIRDAGGAVIGAVGISGDTSDNDEAAAIAGIQAAGLAADPGVD
ncbi:heme-binding protein [Ferrovibrio sp.]|uniref:GlcG/HbpS family heme-binding protein n=1 Tax=Ferrovibrio sp. TaxID=1917215 RepID=UPI001B4E73A0|nr:heme-binding protein [Ferrovibrio sp.]MBP7063304.1 heme-binding protein [Ferrovibrio sp.]